MRHPLRGLLWIGVGGFVIWALWLLVGPVLPLLNTFAPLIAIAAGLGFLIWKFPLKQGGDLFWDKEKDNLTTFGRLLAAIAFVIWFIFAVNYVHGEPWINNFFFGVSERDRWVIVVILVALAHLPLSPLANFIVPTKGAFMRAVIYAVFVVVIAYTGSRAHTTHDFFNPETGTSVAYVDPTTNKPYYHDGWAPDTGEKLVPVTKEVAQKLKKQSPIDLAKQKVDGLLKDVLSRPSPPPPSSPPPAPAPEKEKKIIAVKKWREATEEDLKIARTWSLLGSPPAVPKMYQQGAIIKLPGGGEGSCGKIFAESGRFRTTNGNITNSISNCNNMEMVVQVVTPAAHIWKGWCRAPDRRCLKFN